MRLILNILWYFKQRCALAVAEYHTASVNDISGFMHFCAYQVKYIQFELHSSWPVTRSWRNKNFLWNQMDDSGCMIQLSINKGWPPGEPVDSFTVSMHNPYGRQFACRKGCAKDCQSSLKKVGSPTDYLSSPCVAAYLECTGTGGIHQSIFRFRNHKIIDSRQWQAVFHASRTTLQAGWCASQANQMQFSRFHYNFD